MIGGYKRLGKHFCLHLKGGIQTENAGSMLLHIFGTHQTNYRMSYIRGLQYEGNILAKSLPND
jgi:hypothetical protein